MTGRRRVLVTGASGEVAAQILPRFRSDYELILLDVRATDRRGQPVAGVTLADLSDPDRRGYRHHFEGIQAADDERIGISALRSAKRRASVVVSTSRIRESGGLRARFRGIRPRPTSLASSRQRG